MNIHPARALSVLIGVVILSLVIASPVVGHTGDDVSLEHVIIEVATWALAVAAVIAGIVAVFWVRARVSRR